MNKPSNPHNPSTATPQGCLSIIGIGPGSDEHITPRALQAIREADVVIGYSTYIQLVKHLLEGKEVIRAKMMEEIDRARIAISRAQGGARVALISSGDAGVYGMSSLVLQVLHDAGWQQGDNPAVEMVPGITAINACASLVGAPLGHDFCTISLSDLLTPWRNIVRKIEAAASADFVLGLYNPASGRRTRQIVEAQAILLSHRAADTPVALVKSAYRKRQEVIITDLEHFLDHQVGMLTTVLIGNSQSRRVGNWILTPRGYSNKYDADGDVLPGQKAGRSLVEA